MDPQVVAEEIKSFMINTTRGKCDFWWCVRQTCDDWYRQYSEYRPGEGHRSSDVAAMTLHVDKYDIQCSYCCLLEFGHSSVLFEMAEEISSIPDTIEMIDVSTKRFREDEQLQDVACAGT